MRKQPEPVWHLFYPLGYPFHTQGERQNPGKTLEFLFRNNLRDKNQPKILIQEKLKHFTHELYVGLEWSHSAQTNSLSG